MTRQTPPDQEALRAHLDWLRLAIRDRHVDVRLVLEGLLDAVEALAARPGAPRY